MSTEAPTSLVHDTAEIEDGVTIGPGAQIWRHSHVRRGASIGAGASLGSNVFVDLGVRVGERAKVQNNVSLHVGVELEDEVFVGPSAVFTNDLNPRAVSPNWVVTSTLVRFGAAIGANATIVCGNELGEHCLVGAGSVVTRPVLAHQLVLGNPARPAGWVCRCGRVVSKDVDRPTTLECDLCPHEA